MGRAPPPPPPRPPAFASRGLRLLGLQLLILLAPPPPHPALAAPTAGNAVGSATVAAPRPCSTHGALYQHGQQVVRADPCELCLCLDGALFCWWQHCPPTGIQGPCRASQALAACANATAKAASEGTLDATAAATTAPTAPAPAADTTAAAAPAVLQPESSSAPDAASATPALSCHVMGTEYRLGEVLPRDTGTCLECVCSVGGRVTCGPRDCASADARPPQASLDMFDVDTF